VKSGVIERNGRISTSPSAFSAAIGIDPHGARRIPLSSDHRLWLTQWDIRELQKAKGAIRAAIDVLLG
jgi:uncharacterized 2Fe-2S/4Fe-4S cluster protein (DUF4445 family)